MYFYPPSPILRVPLALINCLAGGQESQSMSGWSISPHHTQARIYYQYFRGCLFNLCFYERKCRFYVLSKS